MSNPFEADLKKAEAARAARDKQDKILRKHWAKLRKAREGGYLSAGQKQRLTKVGAGLGKKRKPKASSS